MTDSFLRGRLGKLVLKKQIDHAYSRQKILDGDTCHALLAMKVRLESGKPVEVIEAELKQSFIYTDAAYEQDGKTGGIGAVFVNEEGQCVE